jgi:antirestriction protein ArdC
MSTQTHPHDVYAIITNSVIEQLENCVIPWRMPWAEGGFPQNLFTKRYYTSINIWLLGSRGYNQNYFLTWKQLKAVGASVKKGEKGVMVVYLKHLQNENNADQQAKTVLRYYFVFNIAQIDHLPEILTIPYPPDTINPMSNCDEIVELMPNSPNIKTGKGVAKYDVAHDVIIIPKEDTFASRASYYFELFKQLVHSTGHSSRLNRREIVHGGNPTIDDLTVEELTVEIGASYLCAVSHTPIVKEKELNIKLWAEAMKKDSRLLMYATDQAIKAADYILNAKVKEVRESMAEQLETQ